MKSFLIIAASFAMLAGCSNTQQASLDQKLNDLNQTNLLALQAIKNGCAIVQPTLIAAGAASPQIGGAAAANAVVCATAAVAADAASAVVAAHAPVAASDIAAK